MANVYEKILPELEKKREIVKQRVKNWLDRSAPAYPKHVELLVRLNAEIARYRKLARKASGSGILAQNHGAGRPKRSKKPRNERWSFITPVLEAEGLSIHDWATKANVDWHTADNYLKNKTNPRPSTRKKLAEALRMNVENLPR